MPVHTSQVKLPGLLVEMIVLLQSTKFCRGKSGFIFCAVVMDYLVDYVVFMALLNSLVCSKVNQLTKKVRV